MARIKYYDKEVNAWKYADMGAPFNYSEIKDKPKINGFELIGNKTGAQLNLLDEEAVIEDLTSTSITLAKAKNNTVYKYGTLNSLTITAIDTATTCTTIIFTTATSVPTINLPDSLEKVGFTHFEAGKKYVIAIQNNIAVMGIIE